MRKRSGFLFRGSRGQVGIESVHFCCRIVIFEVTGEQLQFPISLALFCNASVVGQWQDGCESHSRLPQDCRKKMPLAASKQTQEEKWKKWSISFIKQCLHCIHTDLVYILNQSSLFEYLLECSTYARFSDQVSSINKCHNVWMSRNFYVIRRVHGILLLISTVSSNIFISFVQCFHGINLNSVSKLTCKLTCTMFRISSFYIDNK